MFELQGPITAVEIVLAACAAMVLGDYLGFKIGRWKLAIAAGSLSLLTVLVFVAYAIIVLR